MANTGGGTHICVRGGWLDCKGHRLGGEVAFYWLFLSCEFEWKHVVYVDGYLWLCKGLTVEGRYCNSGEYTKS